MQQDSDHPSRNPHNCLCDLQFTHNCEHGNSVNEPARGGCAGSTCFGLKQGTRGRDVPAASVTLGRFNRSEPNSKGSLQIASTHKKPIFTDTSPGTRP